MAGGEIVVRGDLEPGVALEKGVTLKEELVVGVANGGEMTAGSLWVMGTGDWGMSWTRMTGGA